MKRSREAPPGPSSSTTPFRAAEKALKAYRDPRRQQDPQVWSSVIDFDDAEAHAGSIERLAPAAGAPPWLGAAHIWSLRGVDGFRFIRCPFDENRMLDLAQLALTEWIEPPSATNLPTAAGVTIDGHAQLWDRHQREPEGSLLSRLAWATVGYQYQWTERRYDPSKRSPFPPELAVLSSELAAACGWQLTPEAAIINLYGPASTMGGHKDDAEPCQTAPIVSISLGLECVYLLGGETKADPPVALRLRSGDVVVQGGASRRYVHGVPRIFAGSLPPALSAESPLASAAAALRPVASWLETHRLNINVRQVFDRTCQVLDCARPDTAADDSDARQ